MELLQVMLTFFSQMLGGEGVKQIVQLFIENSFDVKKVFSSLTPEILAPVVKEFMEKRQNKSPTVDYTEGEFGLKPVVNFANKEIIFALKSYLD